MGHTSTTGESLIRALSLNRKFAVCARASHGARIPYGVQVVNDERFVLGGDNSGGWLQDSEEDILYVSDRYNTTHNTHCSLQPSLSLSPSP